MRKKNVTAASAPDRVAGLEWASDAKLKPIPWLWPGCIPAHTLTMIEGRKCTGKSTVLAAIAASITGGPLIPGWTGPRDARVIWCGSEESWEAVTAPRLLRAGADLRRIARLSLEDSNGRKRRLLLPEHFNELRDLIAHGKIGLLVLDPYVSLISPSVDTRMEQSIRSVLEPLLDMSWEMKCTTLLVRHVRKGKTGDAREAGLGGAGLTNVCRSLIRIDEHLHQKNHSVLSPVVVSASGKPLAGQVFKIDYDREGSPVVWKGATDMDAQTLFEGVGDAVERGETSEAEQLLVEIIGDTFIRVRAAMSEAENAGISLRCLRRAKERLGIDKRRVSYGEEGFWEWGPPKQGWPKSVSHLVIKKKGTHAHGGALNFAKAKNDKKHRKTTKGAKAPPVSAPTPGALPSDS